MLLKLFNSSSIYFYLTMLFFSHVSFGKALNIHGFVSQGVAFNPDSSFISAEDDITFDLTEVGLNFSYQLTHCIRIAGQTTYLNGGNRYDEGVNLDYLLVDYNFYSSENAQSHLYAGRIKNDHWLYSSTRDVAVSKPSIILPQSIYLDAARNLAIGGDGVAWFHSYSKENLGKLDFRISSTFSSLSRAEARNLVGRSVQGDVKHEDDLQVSLHWSLNAIPLNIGIAVTDSLFVYESGGNDILIDGDIDLMRYYINFEYFTEKWTLSGEFLEEEIQVSGLFSNRVDFSLIAGLDLVPPPFRPLSRVGQGGFLQVQYRPNNLLKMLMRYERFYGDKDDKSGEQAFINSGGTIPAFFNFQHDFTLGFSYAIGTNFRVDIEHHWVTGTGRVTPIIIPDTVINSNKNWQLSLAQVSYWF